MTPPISIDGTDITGATIDNEEVQEITVDGDTVFTAGPAGAFDLDNLNFDTSVSFENQLAGISFNGDGTAMFTVDADTTGAVNERPLSTSYDIGTAGSRTQHSVPGSNHREYIWNDDGMRGFLLNAGNSYEQIDVSTPYDLSTQTGTTSISPFGNAAQGIAFNSDGTKFYDVDDTGSPEVVGRFDLSTPYDLTTLSSVQNTVAFDAQDITWSTSGDKLYILNRGQSFRVEQYSASTPFSLSGLTFETSLNAIGGSEHGMFWKPDGSRFWIVNLGTHDVEQYTL